MKLSVEDTIGELENHGMIACPSCGHQFELSEALTGRIREHLKSELLEEVTSREKELKKGAESLKAEKEALAQFMAQAPA